MRDYTDIQPSLDDISQQLTKVEEEIKKIYGKVFYMDGTNLMVEAVCTNIEESKHQIELAKAVLDVVEDKYEDMMHKLVENKFGK